MGFRSDREFTPVRSRDQARLLVFGDSYTAGEGVGNGRRYTDLLEQKVDGIEVFNFGLPGTGTDQQYLAYSEFAADLEHDILLICPMVENIRRNLQRERLTRSAFDGRMVWRAKPYFELADGDLVLRNRPVPKRTIREDAEEAPGGGRDDDSSRTRRVARAVTREIDKRVPGFRSWTQRVRRLALPEEYNDPRHPGWLLMRSILLRWIGESRVPVLLCPIPTFGHIEGSLRAGPYRERFSELAADAGVELVDLLPVFHELATSARRDLRFARDEHPTERCHEVIAGALAPVVERVIRSRSESRS